MDSATTNLSQTSPRRLRTAAARGRHKSMRGQTLLEFALVAPVFLLIVCGIIDFGRLFYAQMTVQNALREAGRYASTGQCSAPPTGCMTDSKGNVLSQIASIQAVAQQMAPGFNFSGMVITGGGVTGSTGSPGQLVTLTVTNTVPLLTGPIAAFFTSGSGSYSFTASVTFKNEPY